MSYEELLKVLEIESAQDFAFFEQYAELVENEEELAYEALMQLLEEVDYEALTELTEGYFEELLRYMPDEATDLYTLLDTIGKTLASIARTMETSENQQMYGDEFIKFRNWFLFDSEVRCIPIDEGDDAEELLVPVSEALTLYRSQNLTEIEYQFDFEDALNYSIDEYIVSLSSLDSEEDEDDEDEATDYDDY
ncbi:MAG: hypothetical protein LBU41_06085 [Clostridiales Family XIII bacterium]|jgi:hypothetical protein|nr:hypothetical protein [Clostridiales Family XIII bacterium]